MSKHIIDRITDQLKSDKEVSRSDLLILLDWAQAAREAMRSFPGRAA